MRCSFFVFWGSKGKYYEDNLGKVSLGGEKKRLEDEELGSVAASCSAIRTNKEQIQIGVWHPLWLRRAATERTFRLMFKY